MMLAGARVVSPKWSHSKHCYHRSGMVVNTHSSTSLC